MLSALWILKKQKIMDQQTIFWKMNLHMTQLPQFNKAFHNFSVEKRLGALWLPLVEDGVNDVQDS